MRAFKRYGKEGFTLVELMIVVAIIGVLAALAIYGVRRYLASAKTSEAKNTLGAISRAAASAYERENAKSELLKEGDPSTGTSQALCVSAANNVPAIVPKGVKYQPKSEADEDFEKGDALTGWKCLRFAINQPIYYQYTYKAGAAYQVSGVATGAPDPTVDGFEAGAIGDLDGDDTKSYFSRTGIVNTVTKTVRTSTQVFVYEEFE